MRHNRRRRNPVLTPDQVFSAVLADLSIDDPELAAFAYQNAPYFIEYARKAVGDGGSLTEDELIEQIRSTGAGISEEDESIVRDCMKNYVSPQARPADLLDRFLRFLKSEGAETENRDLIEFGVLAYRYGFTTNNALEITKEEAYEIVGYPECDEPVGGNADHIAAFVEWMQSDWLKKAKKRAEGFAPPKRKVSDKAAEWDARFGAGSVEDWLPSGRGISGKRPASPSKSPRRPRRTLMGGGLNISRGGRRGGRRCRSWCNAETPDDCRCGALNNER